MLADCFISDCNSRVGAQCEQFRVYLNAIIIFSTIIDFSPNFLIELGTFASHHNTPYEGGARCRIHNIIYWHVWPTFVHVVYIGTSYIICIQPRMDDARRAHDKFIQMQIDLSRKAKLWYATLLSASPGWRPPFPEHQHRSSQTFSSKYPFFHGFVRSVYRNFYTNTENLSIFFFTFPLSLTHSLSVNVFAALIDLILNACDFYRIECKTTEINYNRENWKW